MDELDLTAAESKASYEEIKDYVLDKYGLKVFSLNIAQIKTKCDKRHIETLPNDLKLNSYILYRAFAYPLWIGGCCFDGITRMKNVGLNVGI